MTVAELIDKLCQERPEDTVCFLLGGEAMTVFDVVSGTRDAESHKYRGGAAPLAGEESVVCLTDR